MAKKNPFKISTPQALAAVQGAGQIAGDIYSSAQATNEIETEAPELTTDAYGMPQYNLGGQAAYLSDQDKKQYGRGLVGKSLLQGAAAGAAFGPLGAGIGAAVGGLAGLIGRGAIRNKAQRKIDEGRRNLAFAQGQFNEQNLQAQQAYLARKEYEDKLKENNIYNFPMNLV